MGDQDKTIRDIAHFLESRSVPREPFHPVTSDERLIALHKLCGHEIDELVKTVEMLTGEIFDDKKRAEEHNLINKRLDECIGVDRFRHTEEDLMRRLKVIDQWTHEAEELYISRKSS